MNPILYQFQIIADQFIKGYRLADNPQGIPNTPQTRFHLGFMTKQFTVRGPYWVKMRWGFVRSALARGQAIEGMTR